LSNRSQSFGLAPPLRSIMHLRGHERRRRHTLAHKEAASAKNLTATLTAVLGRLFICSHFLPFDEVHTRVKMIL
jgi:hypothetical protein